jgi:hypothetical protein
MHRVRRRIAPRRFDRAVGHHVVLRMAPVHHDLCG